MDVAYTHSDLIKKRFFYAMLQGYMTLCSQNASKQQAKYLQGIFIFNWCL